MWGWIAPAKWRAELGISDWSDEQAKGKMAIQFDNGDQCHGPRIVKKESLGG